MKKKIQKYLLNQQSLVKYILVLNLIIILVIFVSFYVFKADEPTIKTINNQASLTFKNYAGKDTTIQSNISTLSVTSESGGSGNNSPETDEAGKIIETSETPETIRMPETSEVSDSETTGSNANRTPETSVSETPAPTTTSSPVSTVLTKVSNFPSPLSESKKVDWKIILIGVVLLIDFLVTVYLIISKVRKRNQTG